ncbi:MAG: ATP synthase F1 subunit delta [Cyanobacteriota bacterium]
MAEEIGITTIADRYAEAVLDIAQENDCLDFVKNDLNTVTNTIKNNSDFKDFLFHPIIPINDKKEIIDKIFIGKINPYVINLIKLLIDRNRIFIFQAITSSFQKLFNKRFNITIATITTAVELNESIKESIRQKLADLLSKHVEMESKINSDIIGGVIIQIDDNIIDGSIRGRLEEFKRQLV